MLISTNAAAPSEIALEFAAVIVPLLSKAGFSEGILLSRIELGNSSFDIKQLLSDWILAISFENEAFSMAFFALIAERTAHSSICSRL